MKRERIFIIVFTFVATALFLGIAAVNYLVDPLHVFSKPIGSSYEEKLAKTLSEHDNVAVTNMDERQFIFARLNLAPAGISPKYIIIGSSRVMQIGNYIFDENVLNLGVSAASLEDDITILDVATSKLNPETIVIGVDPWIFNEHGGQIAYQTLEVEYQNALIKLNFQSDLSNSSIKNALEHVIGEINTLIGYAYTQESITAIKKSYLDNGTSTELPSPIRQAKFDKAQETSAVDYVATDAPLSDRDVVRKDGSRVYNLITRNQSQEVILEKRKQWLDYMMKDYLYSSVRHNLFVAMLKRYKAKYKIVLELSPYHPAVYKMISDQRPVVLEVENELRNIATAEGIAIIGSYDPSKAGCDASEFYDGAHPKGSCMKKIMAALR